MRSHTLSHTLSLATCLMILSLGTIGCQTDTSSSSSSLSSEASLVMSDLGTLQGKLRLPQDQECSVFTAYQVDEEEDRELFAIDVDQAQVRNNSYSFLHDLPQGDYQVKGRLSCTSAEGNIEHESLHDEVSIAVNQIESVQFRFFFDVENELSQVDLKFCADLALRSLSPALEACQGEQIMGQYEIDWLRDDCGEIFLQLQVDEATFEGPVATFPNDSLSISGFAPERVGSYELMIAISAPTGGHVELHHSVLEVVACNEDREDNADLDEANLICDSEEMVDQLIAIEALHNEITEYILELRELLVRSQASDLSEAQYTTIQQELEATLLQINETLEASPLDVTVNPIEIRCTFSDLNGVCGDTDRSFSQDISSLMVVMNRLSSINIDHLELGDITLVDEVLTSISLSRAQLGAMFERFTTLMRHILSEDDLYSITIYLMRQQETLAMISSDDASSDEDREFLNAVFTQLRDESVRLNACHSCDLNLAEMDLSECTAGSCLSVETQEQATEALEGIEMMSEQLGECLAD